MPVKDAIATILNRNSFYRDGYRLLLRISMIQGFVIAVLVVCIAGLVLTVHTKQIYFATTSDGRIISVVPLNEPYRTDAEVIKWAALTAQSVMRFDYKDYKERLQQATNSFTPSGWDAFSKALKESSIIDEVTARKLVISLDVGQAPEIDREGTLNGVYTWHMKFPVSIKFDGNEPPQPINTQLVLTIVRVSTLVDPNGINIQQWVIHNPDERQ
jgi:intracellular multiplication protein IcmL